MNNPLQVALSDIYSALQAGKQLILQFPSMTEATNMRRNIYNYKSKDETQMQSVGIDFDKMQLSFAIKQLTDNDAGPCQVICCLRRKKEVYYTVLSITDANQDVGCGVQDAQVSSNLGKD